MRKITNKVVSAFLDGSNVREGNSESKDGKLLLHGNTIAEIMPNKQVYATLAFWPSPTTRERLNGLCELMGLSERFRQSRNVQLFGQRPIGSNETIVLK